MNRAASEDTFVIQTRLFRMFQLQENIDVVLAEKIFKAYEVFDYIAVCYEEFHVQGDDTNLEEIYQYLEKKGWERQNK